MVTEGINDFSDLTPQYFDGIIQRLKSKNVDPDIIKYVENAKIALIKLKSDDLK